MIEIRTKNAAKNCAAAKEKAELRRAESTDHEKRAPEDDSLPSIGALGSSGVTPPRGTGTSSFWDPQELALHLATTVHTDDDTQVCSSIASPLEKSPIRSREESLGRTVDEMEQGIRNILPYAGLSEEKTHAGSSKNSVPPQSRHANTWSATKNYKL